MDVDHWSWRVMLVAEGSLPFLWLAIWLKFVQDHPAQAAWMPESERVSFGGNHCEGNILSSRDRRKSSLPALLCCVPRVFLLAAVYFCFISGQMGLLFWLPSAMENLKKTGAASRREFSTPSPSSLALFLS